MANISRGTYEPPNDDVHIFDGAEEDDDAEGSRLPLLIVIALFVLAAFGGVVWLAYTRGVAQGRSDAPRIIAAEPGPAKVAADGNAQTTPYKGLKIYQQPAPADEEADRQVAAPPVETQPEAQAPETAVVTPPHPDLTKPAGTAPAPLKVAKPAPPPPPEIRTTTPTTQTAEATAPPAELTPKAPASGGFVLQIGAYKSQAEADAAWGAYRAKHAATLAGYSESVRRVELGAKGTWYRLRVGSFASKDAAASLCGKLTAEGGACFPAK